MKKKLLTLLFWFLIFYGNSKIIHAQNNPDWFSPAQVHSSNDILRTGNLIDSNFGNAWTPNVWTQQSYWVVFDLGGSYEIEKIRSWHNRQWDRETAITEIYVSNDINNWGESLGSIGEIYNKPQGWIECSFPKRLGRYVKLVSGITKCPYWRELQVYGGLSGSIQMFSLVVNSENGVVQKSPDLSEYESGTVVRLTAIPDQGFIFNNWSGDVSGSENPIDVTMDGNKIVTTNFSFVPVDTLPQTVSGWYKPYKVNSSNDLLRTNNLIDGNVESIWLPAAWTEQSYWVVLDLGENAQVDKIRSWHRRQWDTETGITQIFLSDNLIEWGESIGRMEKIYNQVPGWKEADLINKSGRYLKLVSDVTKCTYWCEIEIFGKRGKSIPDIETEPTDTTDTTTPSRIASVRDGVGADLTELKITDQLSANWDTSSDVESGILRYWYTIGTSAGGIDIVDWTSTGLNTQVTRSGLSLTIGTTYFFSVRAENGSGLFSVPTNSNGVIIVDELTPVSHEVYITCESGTDISDDIQSTANYLETIGGGTIFLPTGEFLFNTTVNMAGGISLIGQGQDNTILNSKTTAFLDINHNGNKGGAMRISGISFNGWTSDAGYTHRGISLANIVDFRIDHIYIEGCGYTININGSPLYPKPRGVVDHCTIIKGRGVYNSVYGVTTGPYLWENDNRIEFLGTREAVFIEDCYIEGCSHATDAFGGGHYVLRNSTIYNCSSVGGHGVGFEDSGRGIRCAEVYNNTIKKSLDGEDRLRWIMIGIRGGGGVIFNNIIENAQHAIQFTIDTGALVDTNSDGVYDYPAMDQTHDRWIWNNTLINCPILIMHYGIPAQQLILENRDYFLREPSLELDGFTYTPYLYPHPLTQETPLAKSVENNLNVSIPYTDIPKDFYLDNAYPNPFNPTTVISYNLPQASFVTLKVFNILGKEIVKLVNEKKEAGSHKVEFNAKNLPSGVYVYTIQANNYIQSKKMLLIK